MNTLLPRFSESDGFLVNDQRNGHGVLMYVPESPQDFGDKLSYQDETVFPEATDIALRALRAPNKGLLVLGEPGSGKSHLVDDLVLAHGAANNAPAMTLSLHLVGGSATGLENAKGYVDTFTRRIGDTQGLVVLDNLDYLGYRGSRRLNRAREFSKGIAGLTDYLLANPRLVTVGIVHDNDWRAGNWKWDDDELNKHAEHALNVFPPDVYKFRGILSVAGLVEVIHDTWQSHGMEMTDAQAERHIGKLATEGRADFFHARHVDPWLYATNPDAAIAQAEAGRILRKKM